MPPPTLLVWISFSRSMPIQSCPPPVWMWVCLTGQMGNSEVGHTNIGAGRVVFQDLPRISKSIDDGDFFQNPAYVHAMDACKEKRSALHLMGLLSDGGVHSHIDHLFALIADGQGPWP